MHRKLSGIEEKSKTKLESSMSLMINWGIETITRVGEDYGLEIKYVDGTIDKIFMKE